jgi:hypothetical protein
MLDGGFGYAKRLSHGTNRLAASHGQNHTSSVRRGKPIVFDSYLNTPVKNSLVK